MSYTFTEPYFICARCDKHELRTSASQKYCGNEQRKEGCAYLNKLAIAQRYADKRKQPKRIDRKLEEWGELRAQRMSFTPKSYPICDEGHRYVGRECLPCKYALPANTVLK